MTRAMLFDFDGTLADSYPAIAASVNHVRAMRGLPPLTVEQVVPLVGRGLPKLLEDCVPGTDIDVDSRRYREHHPTVLRSGTRLNPGAVDVLTGLRARGWKTGICSNKPRPFTDELVNCLGLSHLLDTVVGPDDVPAPKPAPDMLIEALRRLDAPAESAIYVGDMIVDIQTARAAGVKVWAVPTGSQSREELIAAQPDRLLSGLPEILDRV